MVKADSDSDGLTNPQEEKIGTNPNKPDTDNDGLLDKREIKLKTSPVDYDTDGDGLGDGEEINNLKTDAKTGIRMATV